MMDRDVFIQAMINELTLKEQKAKSANKNSLREEQAKYAFEQLCYDYPQIPVSDIKCLTEQIFKQLQSTREISSVFRPYLTNSTPLR